jgi:hypothetical protein
MVTLSDDISLHSRLAITSPSTLVTFVIILEPVSSACAVYAGFICPDELEAVRSTRLVLLGLSLVKVYVSVVGGTRVASLGDVGKDIGV